MPHPRPSRREIIRLASAALVVASATVFVLLDLDRTAVTRLAIVSMVVVPLWLVERRLTRRLRRLEREVYWQAYSDAVNDLGGIGRSVNEDPSGEIPRVPHR